MKKLETARAQEARTNAAITINSEGIGYAVQDYCSGKNFSGDPQCEKLWDKAADALNELTKYLQKELEDNEM